MINISNNNIREFFFYLFLSLSFLSEYKFINSSVIPYIIILILIIFDYKKIQLNKFQAGLVVFFFFYLLLIFFYCTDLKILFKNLKYWFGFFLVYFYFYIYKYNFNYLFLLRFLCLVVITESLLINTIIDQEILYHTPNNAYFFNIYQRPPSFGGISSVTGIGLIFLYFYNHIYVSRIKYYDTLIFLLSILLLFSTSAFILLSLVFLGSIIFKKKKDYFDYSINFFVILSILFIIVFINYFENLYLTENFNFEKITISYFKKIFLVTILDFYEYFLSKDFSLNFLFGNQILGILETSGDNAYLIMLEQVGLIGLIIILFSIYIFSNKKAYFTFSLFLIYISNFHYYPLGTIMVQIIIINLMLYNEKNQ
tara:strand:+ start:552 stop:1655 length:1104 start_codon:yes stop_codon:yes gene_type:complete